MIAGAAAAHARSIVTVTVVAGALAGCTAGCTAGSDPPITSCASRLAGHWHSPAGTYHVLDLGPRLEIYPSFRDLPADLPPGVVAAPSVIDLARKPDSAVARGTLTRRYELGTSFCRIQAPATLLRCQADRLTLEIAEPVPPTDWTACTGPTGPTRLLALTR